MVILGAQGSILYKIARVRNGTMTGCLIQMKAWARIAWFVWVLQNQVNTDVVNDYKSSQ